MSETLYRLGLLTMVFGGFLTLQGSGQLGTIGLGLLVFGFLMGAVSLDDYEYGDDDGGAESGD